MPTDLPIYNIHLHIEMQHVDSVQSLILFLSCLSFVADFILSGSVFHSMLHPNFGEFNPYLTVFVLDSWITSLILRLYFNSWTRSFMSQITFEDIM